MHSYSRSIGVQVNLCGCTTYAFRESSTKGLSNSRGSEVKKVDKANIHLLNDPKNFSSLMSGEGENDKIIEMENEESDDKVFEDNEKCTGDESTQLLTQGDGHDNVSEGIEPISSHHHHHSSSSTHYGSSSSPNHPLNSQETSSPTQKNLPQPTTSSTQRQTVRTTSNDSISAGKRDSHHSYHFKRKFANFRSDSVFSDVMPMAGSSAGTHDPRKGSDPCDNSGTGSLPSLKPKESKWISLRKKLKINVSSNSKEKEKNKSLEQKNGSGSGTTSKDISQKRTLFQRAKTLAILPVKSSSRDAVDGDHHQHHRKAPKPQYQPPELFNVGGEMNMIPLELLIDVSELNISKK